MPKPKPTAPPPAYFLSLSLENVRSFGEKQTIYFTEGGKEGGRPAQWTVILGDNGVGKTTVLKALAALMPTEDGVEGRYVAAYVAGRFSNWSPWRHKGKLPTKLSFSAKWDALLSTPDQGGAKDFTFSFGLPSLRPGKFNFFSYQGAFLDDNSAVNSLICYGYGAGRTVGLSTLSENVESNTCASLFNDRADLLNPEEWFLQADYRVARFNDELTKQKFDLIRQALETVLVEVNEVRVTLAPESGNPEQGLQFETPYGWVRLKDMSLGYQTLVVWLADFASKLFIRYPESKNPLAEPAIVLIDEIDLHLHPSWQRKLLKSLSEIFPNTQFIATAHSPLVVQAAGDAGANVVLLKREGDQTIVHQNVEDVRGWRLDQILTSELFGLETARSLDTERKLKRRAQLLTKARRTAAEKKELEELTQQLDAEPLGETPSEREVNAVLQELRQRLLKKDPNNLAA